MDKFSIAVLVAFMCLSVAQAQEVRYGVKGGLNFAGFRGDFNEDVDMRTVFHLGGLAEISFTDQFSLQPEILYSEQGAKGETGDITFKLAYLHFPLMGKYKATEALSLEFGPQFGFKMWDKAQLDGDNYSLSWDPEYKSFDFGLNFGLGYELPNGLFFNGRYGLGFTNINAGALEDNFDTKNSVFLISVGYFF